MKKYSFEFAGDFILIDENLERDIKPYYIKQHLVTFEEFDKFCSDTGYTKPFDEQWGREKLPVINISFIDCANYCNWLSLKEGIEPYYDKYGNILNENSKAYRIPTFIEWQYAAVGQTLIDVPLYPWGNNKPDKTMINFDKNLGKTSKVGSFPEFNGLYDMCGNVWEWVDENIVHNNILYKFTCGGSFNFSAEYATIDSRSYCSVLEKYNDLGFRIVKSL